ncbi:MAG: hypothetical protein AAGI53_10395 [Planctomycetota bacterium]
MGELSSFSPSDVHATYANWQSVLFYSEQLLRGRRAKDPLEWLMDDVYDMSSSVHSLSRSPLRDVLFDAERAAVDDVHHAATEFLASEGRSDPGTIFSAADHFVRVTGETIGNDSAEVFELLRYWAR